MKTINELQACLLLSLIAHAGLIGADVFNLHPAKEEKPFKVEFEIEEEILPGRYEVKEEKKIEKQVAEKEEVAAAEEPEEPIAEEKSNTEPAAEETSADAALKSEKIESEFKKSLLRYQDSIKQEIQQEKQYPRWALRAGHEGETRIAFSVLSSGHIKDLKLIRSSGFGELDKEAIDAVNRAAPFLSFPETFKEDEIRVELDIIFHITIKPN